MIRRPVDQYRAAAGAGISAVLSPKSFGGRGNFTLGIKEHMVFPKSTTKTTDVWGMDIRSAPARKTGRRTRALLTAFNFPFRQ